MKKLILILCLILTFRGYSQTTTKKYNSIENRYEYFDQNGKMIGYEEYNNISDQWEYYSLKSSSSSNGYGEPQSTFDADLAIMALSKRQAEYDKAVEKVKNFGNYLGQMHMEFSNQIENIRVKNEYNRLFNQNSDSFIDTNFKMIRTPAKHSIVLNRFYIFLKKTYNQAVINVEYNNMGFQYGEYVSVKYYSPLKEEPKTLSKTIEFLEEPVKILTRSEGDFYRVSSKNNIGYLKANWIKGKAN